MNTSIKLITALLFGATVVSCKKEKENVLPTTDVLLHGRWSITHFAWDMNANEVLDDDEKSPAYQHGDFAIAFYPDGTGYTSSTDNINFKTNVQPFLWELVGDKSIRTITSHSQGSDTSYSTIKKLTKDSCILERKDGYATLDWRLMVKEPQ